MKKNNIFSVVSFVLGGLLVGLVLHSRIQTRYDNGFHNGFIQGGYEVIDFLDEHFENKDTKEVAPKAYLDFKATRISVVEIDGVATIHVE